MPFEKQLDGNGQENPLVTLARIDERTKNMNEKLTAHMVSFEAHKIDDEKKFGDSDGKLESIERKMAWYSGGACVIIFLLNWFHK